MASYLIGLTGFSLLDLRELSLMARLGKETLLVRLAYSYSIILIVLIVFVLKALINLYVRSEY